MYFLSREGYLLMRDKLNKNQINLAQVTKEMSYAASLGDLRENSGFIGAQEEKQNIESVIYKIKHVLSNALIVDKPQDDTVGLGSKITLIKDGNDKSTYRIISDRELGIFDDRVIIIGSPISKNLLNKKAGYSFSFQNIDYELTAVDNQ